MKEIIIKKGETYTEETCAELPFGFVYHHKLTFKSLHPRVLIVESLEWGSFRGKEGFPATWIVFFLCMPKVIVARLTRKRRRYEDVIKRLLEKRR